jgi:hypothetical protein
MVQEKGVHLVRGNCATGYSDDDNMLNGVVGIIPMKAWCV